MRRSKGYRRRFGALLIIFLWVAADIILGIIWLVTRKKEPTIVYVQQPPIQA